MAIIDIGLALTCAALDRLRGAGRKTLLWTATRTASVLAYGAILGWAVGLRNWPLVTLAGLWWAGERISGWGNSVGPALHGERPDKLKLHWYQVGPIARSAYLSLAVRGALWGLPAMLLYPWHHKVQLLYPWHHKVLAIPIAYAIAMPLAIVALMMFASPVKRIPATAGEEWVRESKRSGRMWAAQEAIRGFLGYTIALIAAGLIR